MKLMLKLKYLNKMDNKQNGSVPTTLGLLGIAFIILKLCNVINWSWWLVT